MTVDHDILVVGAGIAGLTTAARLLSLGLRVDVVERAAAPHPAGAGITLHPNAMRHLTGLYPALSVTGVSIARQRTTDARGHVSRIDWASVWGRNGLPLAIQRRRLAELLLSAVPADTVRWSAAPLQLTDDDDGVRVGFADGTQRRYRLVVGADGIHSRVRELVSPGVLPHYLGQVYWRTTVARQPLVDFPEWRVWRGGGHFFGAMPIGGQRYHVFVQAALDDPATVGPDGAATEMRARAEAIIPEVKELLRDVDLGEVTVRPALGLSSPRLARGRVAIVGDAAHAVPPSTTQGGGLAVEDGAVLAEEVARYGPAPEALEAYHRRRRPRLDAFLRNARLHSLLLESVQGGPVARTGTAGDTDASAWYRRLYGPLLEPA